MMTLSIPSTSSHPEFRPLPPERLTRLEGWGMLAQSMGYLYRPSTIDGVHAVLELAGETGRSLAPRGAGFSYGDASLNAENIVLDTSRLSRVLDWNPVTGVIRVEPGVTIGQLWRHTLEDGWWPPVVPGTMYPTLGGCASTNVHGKNNHRAGTLGEHLLSLRLLLPSGAIATCGPDQNRDIFLATVGGLGMLGILLELTLQLQPIQSGLLRVEERAARSLEEMFDLFEQHGDAAEYLVGWIDAFAGGAGLGRGLVQLASAGDDDPHPAQTLRPAYQDLPDTLLGVVPRSTLWRGMKLTSGDAGMRAVNSARYTLGARRSGRVTRVPLAQFHFILDYVPNWKWAFRPRGILQYQVFVPEAQARAVFAGLLWESQRAGLLPHLAVMKRQRADPFLLRYSVDGYSLALDYHATEANEHHLRTMLAGFTTQIVVPAGGRFYPAKDNALDGHGLRCSLTPEAMSEFMAIKRRLDPTGILQSDLYRRVFG